MQSVLHVSKSTTPAQLREMIWMEFADIATGQQIVKILEGIVRGIKLSSYDRTVSDATNEPANFWRILTSVFKHRSMVQDTCGTTS